MPRRKTRKTETEVTDYRHADKRKHIPPAALAGQGKVQELPSTRYSYDPHLPPVLRFDKTGAEDAVPALLEEATQRPLTADEAREITAALRNHQPWLEWAGKREKAWFDVDPVALHIHERVAAQAILKLAERKPLQMSLFADPELDYREAVQFYQHEMDWANRLILGDSLLVMHSLARREDLAGKVQMIYLDPPYGIKFASNFQPFVKNRSVKDRNADLTREPEQVKAYRDTWTLGVHSYLAYLRDRLIVAKELLTDSGSIFVQIGEENFHRVRMLLDEVFGPDNFIATITYKTSIALGSKFIDPVTNYLLWFVKNYPETEQKFHRLYRELTLGDAGATRYTKVESTEALGDRLLTPEEKVDPSLIPNTWRPFTDQGLTSRSGSETTSFSVVFENAEYRPTVGGWRTNAEGMQRLVKANRILKAGKTLRFKKFFDDFGTIVITSFWDDVGGGIQSRSDPKIYVVQTANKIIERCMLMTTDPGDLVLDPTCVRRGTRVYARVKPPLAPPYTEGEPIHRPAAQTTLPPRAGGARFADGRRSSILGNLPPHAGGPRGEPREIETLHPGDYVLAHDGEYHRVLRCTQREYQGAMIGLHHAEADSPLWLTADHRVLAHCRPRSLGGHSDWSAIAPHHFGYARELRHQMTPPERKLWSALRAKQLGVKFRRQHPIGPYIADFYTRDAALVVEVDGEMAHSGEERQAYDAARDAYMQNLGLNVLRFPAREVFRNLDGVIDAIRHQCAIIQTPQSATWVEARELQPGDIVFVGPDLRGVPLRAVETTTSTETVFDLEVEGAHSFVTEVCAIHNCGSGTTAYVAEQWGRRWITIDTSRVAIALARQRLLTAKFDYYELAEPSQGISGGLVYKTAPHIMLKTIAQCTALDPVFAKWEPVLDAKLAALNAALAHVTPALRTQLAAKLEAKARAGGKRAVTDADRRRWQLPTPPADSPRVQGENRGWEHWQVPFDTDPDWPDALKTALEDYRAAWRAKMDAVNATIAASAPSEVLVDQPNVVRNVLRVSGPFTVEGVQPAEETLDLDSPARDAAALGVPGPLVGGAPEELDTFPLPSGQSVENAAAYLETMIRLLRKDGVRFPGNKTVAFTRLDPLPNSILHAEGEWAPTHPEGEGHGRVAVSFGPQYGPITAKQVEDCLWAASRGGYDDIIFAGFTIDGAAQAVIQDDPNPHVRCHLAHIRPDVQMGDLLKDTPGSQLFTVFGLPRVALETTPDGEIIVEMQGVDIYDPVTNTLQATRAGKVAAWFLDGDYNGRTFCITQAFFPDSSAWDKLARALKSTVDPARFAAFSGTRSLPFAAGKHRRIAVKVIDPRGNEVLRVVRLDRESTY